MHTHTHTVNSDANRKAQLDIQVWIILLILRLSRVMMEELSMSSGLDFLSLSVSSPHLIVSLCSSVCISSILCSFALLFFAVCLYRSCLFGLSVPAHSLCPFKGATCSILNIRTPLPNVDKAPPTVIVQSKLSNCIETLCYFGFLVFSFTKT